MTKKRTNEQLERKNYFLLYKSKEEIADMLLDELETKDKPKEIEKIFLDIDKSEDSYYDTALIKIASVVDELIDKVNEMSKDD